MKNEARTPAYDYVIKILQRASADLIKSANLILELNEGTLKDEPLKAYTECKIKLKEIDNAMLLLNYV